MDLGINTDIESLAEASMVRVMSLTEASMVMVVVHG